MLVNKIRKTHNSDLLFLLPDIVNNVQTHEMIRSTNAVTSVEMFTKRLALNFLKDLFC